MCICKTNKVICSSSNLAAILDFYHTSTFHEIGSTTTRKRDPESIGFQRPALLYSDTQSVVSFSVIPKRMTLNDLEWLFRVKFCFRVGILSLCALELEICREGAFQPPIPYWQTSAKKTVAGRRVNKHSLSLVLFIFWAQSGSCVGWARKSMKIYAGFSFSQAPASSHGWTDKNE